MLRNRLNRIQRRLLDKTKLATGIQLTTKKQENLSTNPNQQKTEKEMERLEDDEQQDSYDSSSTKTSLYLFGVSSAFMLGGYLMMQMNQLRFDKKRNNTGVKVTSQGKAQIGGQWVLKDTKGNTVTSEHMEGHYYLIYFGFTNCPDICPLSLHKLANAVNHINKMPESNYFKLKVLFVSVDPDRDTNQKIEQFLSLFNTEIIGLTAERNDSENLKDAMNKFRIYASKIEYDLDEEQKSGKELSETRKKNAYTIDHTIITYLFDDQNNFVDFLGANMNEYDMAQKIVNSILTNQKQQLK